MQPHNPKQQTVSIENHTAGYADKCCAASRAIMSMLPPAPNGTTMVTGLEGQSAAAIEPDNRAIAASPEKTTSQRAMHINSRTVGDSGLAHAPEIVNAA